MSLTGKLWLLVFIFCAGICTTPNWARAQNNNSELPDSPSAVARSEHGNDAPEEREASWRTLPRDFLDDLGRRGPSTPQSTSLREADCSVQGVKFRGSKHRFCLSFFPIPPTP